MVWCSTNTCGKKKKNPHREQTRARRRRVGTRGLAAGITFPCAASEPGAAQWPRVTLSERGYYRASVSGGKRKAAALHRLLFLFGVRSDASFKQSVGNCTAHAFFIFNTTQIWPRTKIPFYKIKKAELCFILNPLSEQHASPPLPLPLPLMLTRSSCHSFDWEIHKRLLAALLTPLKWSDSEEKV